jgi:hypothetical protein
MNPNEALNNSAMLAQLNISQWTARKYDKKASLDVERANNAKDAGRYNKVLVAKESLEAITKTATACRTTHYKMTLPWGDNGERLLPATLFEKYTNAIRDHRTEFDRHVRDFVRDYPQLKVDAINRLGGMYEPTDYPPVDDIVGRFSIAVEFTPVPVANDFRVNLNADYIDTIKRDIEQRMVGRQKEAMKNAWSRMREVVSHIHERLADKDKTFRDSLISNAEELLEILPALNIANDPDLAAAAEEVKELLVHPDRLRQDVTLRSQTADRAADILARFTLAPA